MSAYQERKHHLRQHPATWLVTGIGFCKRANLRA